MKPFNDWSEVEVVEYVNREVPETAVSDKDLAPYEEATNFPPAAVALWFRAAYEWLAGQPSVVGGDGDTYLPAKIRGQWFDGQYPNELLPSSIHALGAACLLAAGKEVPS